MTVITELEKSKYYIVVMFLKYVYIVFVGIIIAAFVGVGIGTYYPEPKAPEAPLSVKYNQNIQITNLEALNKIRAEQETYDKAFKAYQSREQIYNRDVSIIALAAAVLVLAASLTILKQISVIADGTLLGGVVTLAYSILRGFGTEDYKFRFTVISIGLAVTVILGYMKFIRQKTAVSSPDTSH